MVRIIRIIGSIVTLAAWALMVIVWLFFAHPAAERHEIWELWISSGFLIDTGRQDVK